MTKKMLIDATHEEETRVAVVDGNRLEEFDYESKMRKALKGSIFLAKVTRVEPSLQAAFVNFGGNRHGFLPFSEIHPDYFRIPIADREALIAEQEAELAEHDESTDVEIDQDAGEVEIVDEDEDDNDDNDSDDADGNTDDDQSDENSGNKKDNRNNRGGRNGNNNRGRGGKGRNNNRGGGKRASHGARKVEVLGGTEYDDEEGNDRFRFSLRRKYKIQEVIKRGQIMLVQAAREERGNKGAAVTSYLSLPGRYCVLMPNSPRAGGVSRKISNYKDRAKMRDIVKSLEVPKGMSVIVRTAGVERTKAEIKRDLDYLLRLWNNIREQTLQSSAPAMIYEEADLIKRAVRDLYTRDIEEIIVSGQNGFKSAKDFMKMMMPSHAKRVIEYKETDIPLFNRYQVENQITEISEPNATMKSGGYLVINPTEALVSIDVNSGRATKERHIEETALKTNLEAADEVARQLRLRDLGGLVVIDFIDMEDRRNNGKVERRLKEALSGDRARIQIGRISSFGLLEMSRQRMNPSLTESQFEPCTNCSGMGRVRTADATSIMLLRAIEEEGIKNRAAQLIVHVSPSVALYLLNNKRPNLSEIEGRYGFSVLIRVDEEAAQDSFRVEVSKPSDGNQSADDGDDQPQPEQAQKQEQEQNNNSANEQQPQQDDGDNNKRGGRRRGRRGGRRRNQNRDNENNDSGNAQENNAQGEKVSQEKPEQDEKTKKAPARGRKKVEPKTDEVKGETAKGDAKQDAKQDPKQESAQDEAPKKKAPSRAKKSDAKDEKPKADAKDKKADKPEKAEKKKPVAKKKAAAKPEASNDTNDGAPKDYEVVNEPPKKKKKGWWSKD